MIKYLEVYHIVIIFSLLLLSVSCNDDAIGSTVKVDREKLDEAFLDAQQIGNLKSLVVFQDSKIVKEAYFGTGGVNNAHDVRSVTKSVVALLIGIAIDKGFIQSVDQHIGDFLRPLVDTLSAEKANITIKHLLTMSSGLEWNELNGSEYNNWITSSNQVKYVLSKSVVAQAGQTFNYNSGALHLLSAILTRVTHMSTKDFAQQYLFTPLDISERNWQTDKQGFYNGGAGLQITPNDMLKIGQLMLNGGEYNGKRIVNQSWISKMATSLLSTNNAVSFGSGYGYCWWTGSNTKCDYIFANGWGGQFIVIVPQYKLIVTATNTWSGVSSSVAGDQWYKTLDIILNKIVYAFKN